MDYWNEADAAVTVCDTNGTILFMNERSQQVFEADGGKMLIGTNLFDCHPEPALTKLKELISSGRTNIYTIEKNGRKKMIYQSPWRKGGVTGGMIELSFELPDTMEHFIRK